MEGEVGEDRYKKRLGKQGTYLSIIRAFYNKPTDNRNREKFNVLPL